jgi:hypothetical protein
VKNLLLIVPTVVQAVAPRERDLIDEMMRAYERFEGDVEATELPRRGAKAGGR